MEILYEVLDKDASFRITGVPSEDIPEILKPKGVEADGIDLSEYPEVIYLDGSFFPGEVLGPLSKIRPNHLLIASKMQNRKFRLFFHVPKNFSVEKLKFFETDTLQFEKLRRLEYLYLLDLSRKIREHYPNVLTRLEVGKGVIVSPNSNVFTNDPRWSFVTQNWEQAELWISHYEDYWSHWEETLRYAVRSHGLDYNGKIFTCFNSFRCDSGLFYEHLIQSVSLLGGFKTFKVTYKVDAHGWAD